MSRLPTLREFWDLCRSHDWHYATNPDPQRFDLGAQYELVMGRLARQSADLAHMLDDWRAHVWHGEPCPDQPEEGL